IIGALAQLVEQPGVLDGDRRLVSESGRERDLLFVERPCHRSREDKHTNRKSFPEERDTKHGPIPCDTQDVGYVVLSISLAIRDVNRLTFEQDTTSAGFTPRLDRNLLHLPCVFR